MQNWLLEKLNQFFTGANRRRVLVRVLAVVMVFCTTYSLILPAIALEHQKAEENGVFIEETVETDDLEETADTETVEETAAAASMEELIEDENTDIESMVEDTADDIDPHSFTDEGSDDAHLATPSDMTETEYDMTETETDVDILEETEVEPQEDLELPILPGETLDFENDTIKVTAVPRDTEIPAGATLVVTQITPGMEAYDAYFSALNRGFEDDPYNGENSLLYDVSIVVDGQEYEPETGSIELKMEFKKNQLSEMLGLDLDDQESPLQVIHLPVTDENSTSSIENVDEEQIEREYIEDTTVENIDTEAVSFSLDSLSVIAVTGVQIKKTVITASGEAYEITVTYGADAGIPDGAELEVEEITEGDALYGKDYDEYVAGTEQALGMEEGSSGYIRLFDIKIVKDGKKVQPAEGTTVDVKIELADAEAGNDLSVVHFADGAEEGEKIEAVIDGQAVCFEADGFSAYSVVSRESANGDTSLDGKAYALVTNNDALLKGEPHPTQTGRLNSMRANPTVGDMLQINGTVTMWTFEAVPGQAGWYYISDGNGNYLNINNGSGDGGTVTLGEKQPVYVASKGSGDNTTYQLRNKSDQSDSKAVNNYNKNPNDGFGAWKAGPDINEWFRFYEMEFLGDISVSFNVNGGDGAAPATVWGLAGDTITLPDYSGTREGYTFIGWSTGTNLGGYSGAKTDYRPLYPAGSDYKIPDSSTTLYAVWNSNSPATAEFYIRLDGKIPDEPGSYDTSAYTSKISITGAIKEFRWVIDNDASKPNNGINIFNEVTARLNQVPDADQIVTNLNSSTNSLGFKVENHNGEVVVSLITNPTTNSRYYNVSEGDALYVLWYVQKPANTWHVDGVLLVKNKVNIAYDGNAPGSVNNVPMGYQEIPGTVVTIGASGSGNGTVKTPTRPGYIFLGWNTKPDGSGASYNNNDPYTLNEDTTLYAQWSKGTNMMTVSKRNEDGETLAGAQFKLEERTSSGSYIEKANRTTGETGIFTYDRMENDTLYRMTETYAPDGYEVQNAFFFKVAVDDSSSTTLKLHVCDENGNFLSDEEKPDWLGIEYIPADDPRAQGVARILFNIRDERIKRSITFIKTDEAGNPLSGAEYTLTGSKGEVSGVLKSSSDSSGVFSVNDAVLPYGAYTLTEDKAPVTYAVAEPVTFTLNDYVNETSTGLTITGGSATAACEVSSVTEGGLTTTTYAYTVKVKDDQQPYIRVTKKVQTDGNLETADIDTTIYYALTKKGEAGYVRKDGKIWIEEMQIADGVPSPAEVYFDGVDIGEYDVWEMALIDGEYTRMYNGLAISDNIQLDSVAASSADGGNNASIRADKISAQVDFTNTYEPRTESTSFIANKKWTDRQGTEISAPEGAVIEFTLYYELPDGTNKKVRSIELDGTVDPDGETAPWQATFKYLPISDENGSKYTYKVKETVTADGFYPNNYPEEYYLTSSGGTITNRRLTTDIELHKRFEIFPESADLLHDVSGLRFTLTKPDGTSMSYALSDFSASVEDPYDYVLTLQDLPLGEYRFEEDGQNELFTDEGYKLVYSVSSAQGESEVGGTQQPVLELALQNSYAKSGTLVVKKNSVIYEAVDEETAPTEISGKSFGFIVKRGSLYLQENGTLGTAPYTFSLSNGESREFANVPAGQYTVTEQDASVSGYVWEVVDGTRNADDTYSKSLTIGGTNDAGEAAFDNRYTKIENASLTVTKTVDGGPEEAKTKEYQVEIKTTLHGEDAWVDTEGNLTKEKTLLAVTAKKPLTFSSIPAGTYTVTEDAADAAFDEYSLDVTYSADGNFTIHKDEKASVEITNTYTYQFTPVKITKTVTGNMGDKTLYFGFDVYVTDADGGPVAVEGMTDAKGMIQFSLKDGEEKLVEKLPKGATLTIVEHNEHYETTISGKVGVNDELTEEDLTVKGAFSETGTDTTATCSFTIPDKGATVAFTNDRTVEKSVILKKIGYDNRDNSTWELAGATFKIYEDAEKKKPVELGGKSEFTSEEDGILYSGKLGAGTYYLDETTVPAGYNGPTGMFILKVSEDGVSLNSTATIGSPDLNSWISSKEDAETGELIYTVSIRNTSGYALPSTGGPGTRLFTIPGSILVCIAGALFVRRRRRTI